MQRSVRMEDISDGRLYTCNDLVKADTRDCQGCSACCKGMGRSIVLDPLDIHRLTTYLGNTTQELLNGNIELNVVDGIILPNLAMTGTEESCSFLNKEGRCSIHSVRPGICRLFPLGRFYENNGFQYFLQVHECPKERTKVKVKKWLDTPNIKAYEQYINQWHYFQKDLQQMLESESDDMRKKVSMYILQEFYFKPYNAEMEFYGEFEQRLNMAREVFLDS